MRRRNRLLALASLLALCNPAPTSAQYPKHCKVDSVAEQNAEYQLTTKEMVVIEPDEGRAKVGLVKLDFCDRVAPMERECPPREYDAANSFRRTLESARKGGMTPSSAQWMLGQACTFPDDAGFEEATGYMVQLWANWYGQSREEAIESVVLRANEERWKKDMDAGCSKLRVPEEASPEEVLIVRARRIAVGCDAYDTLGNQFAWYVDRTDQPPSELARLSYARECLAIKSLKPEDKNQWPKVGLCGPDIRALDRAKIDKETATMPAPLKAHARETLADVKAVFNDLERVVRPKAEADANYKKLLYEAPQAAWDAWVKDYKKHQKAMDATFKFERALLGPSVKAYAGCWGWVESGVIDFVKASKFKSKEAFTEEMQRPVGYTLMNALGSCYAVTAPVYAGALLLTITKDSRVWRGPRSAARYAMIDALNEIKADRTRFPIEFTWLDASQSNLITKEALGGERSKIANTGEGFIEVAQGVVKTSKKAAEKKDTVRVTFKTDSWMEDVVECHNTSEVYSIDNGRVLYRRKCKTKGKAKASHTPNTTLLYEWAAKGIKTNAFVKLGVPAGSDYGDRERWGFPIEVYTNKNKTKLINMYGFAL